MKRTLVVMVKVPRPGRVKTRLGRDIGIIPATWWFRHQLARLLRRIEDPRWDVVLAVAPDAEGLMSRCFPAHLTRWPQGPGNLGDRMERAMRRARGPVCVIGADIPGVTRAHVAQGFTALGNHKSVFGPAPDGGYWLIGVRSGSGLRPRALDGVRWSTSHAMADSRSALGAEPAALIATLADVDTGEDLP